MKKTKAEKIIEIPEYVAIERLKRYIDECDGDELARLLGDMFGGECFHNVEANTYDFKPNEYYADEFLII